MIFVFSKLLIKICEKYNVPGVVGMLLAGILIGLIEYIPGQEIITGSAVEGLGFLAKIGVILILFNAGITTNLKQIKEVGTKSLAITLAGVIVPMLLGFTVACLCNGGFAGMTKEALIKNLFYGVILTATSVSVTVAALNEMGKLHSKVGNTIVAAAIADDIIGIVILSIVISLSGANGNESPALVIIKTVLFFVVVIVLGLIAHKLFGYIEKKYPHHRFVAIFGLSLCFLFAYGSEKWFGIADITGAYAAGLILSGMPETGYIERKSDILGYMIFTPVFFTNIGISIRLTSINMGIVIFGVLFILAGIIGKVIGCGALAKICGFNTKDSLKIGFGMMARAEVALICAQKGVDCGIIDSSIMPFIVILIIVSSFITPIILRILYKNELSSEKEIKQETNKIGA
jgi:Kef-type K+ transport system membrane component KefB